MKHKLVPISNVRNFDNKTMELRSKQFYEDIKQRRTIRDFTEKSVSKSIINNCILSAGTAPSGANMQPWHFAISGRSNLRKIIREQAEKEEKEFYERKASKEWLKALEPLGTNYSKPFLETAPYLICIFVKNYSLLTDGVPAFSSNHYGATG